ncbi:MAG: matrixin family metalloprotease [Dehalococcoidia bacterium]|nr:matrixin family metalloprotease [Dehalococcoidia bacterium]
MRTWLAVVVGFFLVAAGAVAAFNGGRSAAADSIHLIEFEVVEPGGTVVQLHFTVRAEDADGAYAAAVVATRALMPGGTIDDGAGRVSAAYAFWPWAWPAELMPVAVAYNPANAPAGIGPGAITGGIDPWNAVTTSRFRVAYQGFTDAVPGLHTGAVDGANTIGWLELPCASYRNCALGVTAKVEDALEVDIILSSNPEARRPDVRTGEVPDVQTTVLHEVGHLAGLEHSCYDTCSSAESGAVMFPMYQGELRALQADDIAGISALYPVSNTTQPGTVPVEPVAMAYPVTLLDGWNLVVLPPGPLANTMQLLPCAEAVYVRDGQQWAVWLRDGAAALNGLQAASGESAYWLWAGGSCAQTFTSVSYP